MLGVVADSGGTAHSEGVLSRRLAGRITSAGGGRPATSATKEAAGQAGVVPTA
ncbi:hypothetical protein GCM10010443_42150 [Actinoplanes cyaneus]